MDNKIDSSKKKPKRRKTVLDFKKLMDINENYREKARHKAHHRMCDLEELKVVERFQRRRYERVRQQKRRQRADTARAKWKGLRDTFRGELRKVNKTVANGTPCRSTNWEYFDEMLFVRDQIYSNRRTLTDVLQVQQRSAIAGTESSVDEGNGRVDIADLCKQEVVEGDDEIDQLGESEDASSPAPSRQLTDSQLSIPPHLHPTDDDYNFLMSILPQLRSLPTMRNLFVRLRIQELLYSEIISIQDTP